MEFTRGIKNKLRFFEKEFRNEFENYDWARKAALTIGEWKTKCKRWNTARIKDGLPAKWPYI